MVKIWQNASGNANILSADKSYDCDKLREQIKQANTQHTKTQSQQRPKSNEQQLIQT
ncbi:hypothetical protein [Moraxella oblonga]|uniref:hypothetical protein n=1 Tax=Moraxella oblonga TaxID=200413 RepID=UPI000AD5461E|nr:hypothetical protein [Moraxella oblonga]